MSHVKLRNGDAIAPPVEGVEKVIEIAFLRLT